MKTTDNTTGTLGCYAPPKCSLITVTTEGVLCSSIEKPDEFIFDWDANE